MESSTQSGRRSTRLLLEIHVLVTILDPAHTFRQECKTLVVNAHGCNVVVPQRLKDQTPVTLELLSNGATKKGRVVLAIPS